VLAAVVLAAIAATAVVAIRNDGSNERTGVAASAKPQSAVLAPDRWWHPPRAVSTPTVAGRRRPVERPVARAQGRKRTARQTVLVASTVPASSTSSTFATAASRSGGPTPLKAPQGASAGSPSPLRAPRR
jgi:hypothetical protein